MQSHLPCTGKVKSTKFAVRNITYQNLKSQHLWQIIFMISQSEENWLCMIDELMNLMNVISNNVGLKISNCVSVLQLACKILIWTSETIKSCPALINVIEIVQD